MGSARQVTIKGLAIGGGAPVRVESMLKTPLSDLKGCAAECGALFKEGCELVRVAFPDPGLAPQMKELNRISQIPVMADIHFSHKPAIAALEAGCPAIRINPGNMSGEKAIGEITDMAKSVGAVIRIGSNGGSLNNSQMKRAGGDRAAALALAVEDQLSLLAEASFEDIIISAKSSSVTETVRANAILSQKFPFPIHIGITEAGSGMSGLIKSASGIALMLAQGVGDTIRVSLTGPSPDEVRAGYSILSSLEIRKRGYNLISCPACGRRRLDVEGLVKEVVSLLPESIRDGTTIAVMGCEVNGPKEAAGADLGIAGTPDGFVIFTHGMPLCSDKHENLKRRLLEAIKGLEDR